MTRQVKSWQVALKMQQQMRKKNKNKNKKKNITTRFQAQFSRRDQLRFSCYPTMHFIECCSQNYVIFLNKKNATFHLVRREVL